MKKILYLNLVLLLFISCKAQKIIEMEQNSKEIIKSNTMEILIINLFIR